MFLPAEQPVKDLGLTYHERIPLDIFFVEHVRIIVIVFGEFLNNQT